MPSFGRAARIMFSLSPDNAAVVLVELTDEDANVICNGELHLGYLQSAVRELTGQYFQLCPLPPALGARTRCEGSA